MELCGNSNILDVCYHVYCISECCITCRFSSYDCTILLRIIHIISYYWWFNVFQGVRELDMEEWHLICCWRYMYYYRCMGCYQRHSGTTSHICYRRSRITE